jgi:hypothetical protein
LLFASVTTIRIPYIGYEDQSHIQLRREIDASLSSRQPTVAFA